jgi:hypothetical protein
VRAGPAGYTRVLGCQPGECFQGIVNSAQYWPAPLIVFESTVTCRSEDRF